MTVIDMRDVIPPPPLVAMLAFMLLLMAVPVAFKGWRAPATVKGWRLKVACWMTVLAIGLLWMLP